ncbi:ATP-binding protein [Amycolatopsis sp. NPDC049688]|uniref:ATP-binding protein n=1 Tax=Amycolatopsis sp. NPDC049688 TaxID=3154733 RepID=UPI003415BE76
MPEPTIASRGGSLTTRHGWSSFVDDTPTPPELLLELQWRELDNTDREVYDEARIRHHARLVTVATTLVSDITRTGRRLTLLNRDQTSARRGLIVSGEPGTGKTTAITQLGKHHEITARRRRGDVPGPFLPVVYVTVPPAATPKMLAGEFARFLGLPIRRYSNQAQITTAFATCSTAPVLTWSLSMRSITSPSTPATAPRLPTS